MCHRLEVIALEAKGKVDCQYLADLQSTIENTYNNTADQRPRKTTLCLPQTVKGFAVGFEYLTWHVSRTDLGRQIAIQWS